MSVWYVIIRASEARRIMKEMRNKLTSKCHRSTCSTYRNEMGRKGEKSLSAVLVDGDAAVAGVSIAQIAVSATSRNTLSYILYIAWHGDCEVSEGSN